MARSTVMVQIILLIFFLGHGVACLFSKRMELEFVRYRAAPLLKLTGFLQIAAAMGLALGFWYPPLTVVSAGGLTLMMAAAIVIRIRIRDSLTATLPAIVFFGLNLYILLTNR